MLHRLPSILFFLVFLLGCEEHEPHMITRLQGRWQTVDQPHLAIEFEKSVVRFETAQKMGTDQCGGTRWNTILEVYNFSINHL